MESIGERIKRVRGYLGLTQEEFGAKISTARNTIAGYEIGRREPSNQVIDLICKTFRVNGEWLRTGAGEMMAVDASGELEAVAQKYGLSTRAQIIVERFVNLKQADQDVVADYIEQVAEGFRSARGEAPAAPAASSYDLPKTEEEAAELARQAFRMQKKAEDGSSASSSTDSSGNVSAG